MRGIRLVRKRNCSAIFATGPIFSALPLAALVSFATRRPLIVDYRDPWGENDAFFKDRPHKQRYNLFLERLCLSQSARAVFATEGFRKLYAERHPDLAARFVVIPNGYDRDPGRIPAPPEHGTEPYRIGYAGKMFGDQYPVEPLFRAVHALVEKRGADCIRLELAGVIDPASEALLDELDLREVVSLRGYLGRAAVEDLQARSHALLLIIGDELPFLFGLESAKLFEYMPLRRPILGLVPENGAAWKILEEHELGPLASPSDRDSIARAIECLLDGRASSRVFEPPVEFQRRQLTERLAALLHEVTSVASPIRHSQETPA
jgi:glycosyltransferase involved in cell wall biosynthesis